MIVVLVCVGLGIAMFLTLASGGWTIAKAVMLASCLAAAPWVGFCAANGVIGFVLRLPLAVPPAAPIDRPPRAPPLPSPYGMRT